MPRQNINFKNQRLDVAILHKGIHQNVELGTGLRNAGWRGGLFVRYSNGTAPLGNTGKYLGIVEKSPGTGGTCGFLLFASTTNVSDDPEFFSSYKPETTGVAAINMDRGKYKFFNYEVYTAATRNTPTPVAIVYNLNERLYVSLNALLTNEQEFGGASIHVGKCFHVPVIIPTDPVNPRRHLYVGIDVNID